MQDIAEAHTPGGRPTHRQPHAQSRIGLAALAILLLTAALAYGYLLPGWNAPQDIEALVSPAVVEAKPGGYGEHLPLNAVSQNQKEGSLDAWRAVEFPIHWRHTFPAETTVWYRFQVPGDSFVSATSDNGLLGIYIWRVNQTADVWVNGVMVGNGGGKDVRYWNNPLYFTFPAALVRADNQILIRHYAGHTWGSMQNIVLGADANLRPLYAARYFVQHDIAIGLFVFVSMTGIFCLAIWYFGRREVMYYWFAIGSIGSALYCANQFVHHLWVSADLWRWMTNVGTDLWACSLVFVILRSLELRLPMFEKMVFGYLAVGIPVYFYASFYQFYDLNIYFHIGSIVLVAYISGVAVHHFWRTQQTLSGVYAIALVIGVLAGIHDTVMQAVVNNGWQGQGFQYGFNLLPFIAPFSFLLLGVSLLAQFIRNLNSADRLNAELESRIADARSELEDNYRITEQVLVKQSAQEERERIYRDLHDDVGSKLLSLYYRLDDESNSTLAKSALEDLRDIVSRRSMENCRLSAAIGQWKIEAHRRCEDAGVELDWHVEADDCDPLLEESQHVQLRRMLREVFSNAILHNPRLRTISALFQADASHLSVRIENDGVESASENWQEGRGISNLRLRSRELNGQFSLTDSGSGKVCIAWTIPLIKTGKSDE